MISLTGRNECRQWFKRLKLFFFFVVFKNKQPSSSGFKGLIVCFEITSGRTLKYNRRFDEKDNYVYLHMYNSMLDYAGKKSGLRLRLCPRRFRAVEMDKWFSVVPAGFVTEDATGPICIVRRALLVAVCCFRTTLFRLSTPVKGHASKNKNYH